MDILLSFSRIEKILIIYLISINLTSFLVYGLDKIKAKNRSWRIPEINLFLLALLGGATGGLMAMTSFRHKLSRKRFTLGLPIIIVINYLSLLVIISNIK